MRIQFIAKSISIFKPANFMHVRTGPHIRGMRNLTNFDYEAQMAAMNRKLRPQVETVFLLPDAPLACISSTLVREISKLGGDVGQMVSPAVAAALATAHAGKGG